MRINFFARNEGTFVALALLGGIAVMPFAINNLVQERWALGLANAGIATWFLLHGIAVYRGRRLLPPWVVFGPSIPMLAYIMWARGEVGIFWAYPAALLFHFILERRAANLFNASVVVITTFFAYQSYGNDVALRVAVTLVLTITFANIFSYVSEAQRRREAEQEQLLELERDRLALLVHATQAGFTDWDTKENVVIYSERFKEMLGYPLDFDTSAWRSFFDLMHPEDHARVRTVFRSLMREKRNPGLQPPGDPLEYRLLRADGGHIWVKAASLAQVDAAGRIRRFITSFQDVTAYRATADALRDQLKLSTDVFDAIPIGLAMRDLEGRYVFVNHTWEKYTGARREDVIGKTVRDRAPKEEAERVEAEDREALARGPGAPAELKDLHYGDKRYVLTRTVITDANGAPRGVVVASLDTTERYAMEERLVGEQRRAALLMRAASVGILDWDGINRTVYYSPRFKEILRYPADADTSGWPDFWDMVHPDDRERSSTAFRNHIAGRTGSDVHELIQYRLRRADGTYVWVEAFGASVRDARGFATRFIGSITDISERRFQEEALRTAVRLREEVERMSRHDLKTPINSVIAMARLLREDGKLAREDEQMLDSIERAGYRVLNMVNLSLDLFRMEQGSYEFRPRPVDLAEVARRVAADLESQAASKAVAVRVRAEGARTAHAEEPLCYSMLANLIKNAIEAAPDGSAVTVSIESAPGDSLAVQVHNAGAVPDEVRARFFQKYTTAGKSGGTGLGAYSARLLARVQQGDILLRTSEAEGTTLTIRLALAPSTPAAPPAEGPAALPAVTKGSSDATGAKRRILIVDDDDFNRMVMRRFLPSPAFEVAEAVNGRAAVEAARRSWPDAVLLDLEMPVMDGYQAAAKLREMEREGTRKRCTIVAISSNDEDAIVRRALAAGCDYYQVKPAPRETLLRLLAGDARAATRPPAAAEPGPQDPVEVDPDLEAALPGFLASRREALREMSDALGAGDRVRFKKLAHKVAGSLSLYGFRWAAAACRALEKAAPAGDAAELAGGTEKVRAHLGTVEVRLRAGAAK